MPWFVCDIFKPRYLKVCNSSLLTVNTFQVWLLTIFWNNFVPAQQKSSTCAARIPCKVFSLCQWNIASSYLLLTHSVASNSFLVLASFGWLINISFYRLSLQKAALISIVLVLQLREDVLNFLFHKWENLSLQLLCHHLQIHMRPIKLWPVFSLHSVSIHLTEIGLCFLSSTSSYTLLILQFSNSFSFVSATSKVPPIHNKTSLSM